MKTELLRRQFEATLNFSPSREPRKITREKREKNCEFLRFFYVENGGDNERKFTDGVRKTVGCRRC